MDSKFQAMADALTEKMGLPSVEVVIKALPDNEMGNYIRRKEAPAKIILDPAYDNMEENLVHEVAHHVVFTNSKTRESAFKNMPKHDARFWKAYHITRSAR